MYYRKLFFAVVGLLICALAYADIPKMINFQGRLTDAGGKFVPDGNYSLTFRIYTDSTGGSAKWTEAQTIAVSKGLFNVVLGSIISIPDSIFNYSNTYLGIQVGADPEMTPRQRFSSLGYAYRGAKADTSSYSMNSDKLDGLDASDFSSPATDYGRSGVATDLYEGATTLTNKYVNEGQANSITSGMITDNQIVDADISASANISASKINDGSGSGLDADLLDGQNSSAFLSTSSDYGRSGIAKDLYEGDSTLTSRYVNEGQASSVSSGMITDGQIVDADISSTAAIAPSKISGTAWTSTNDGAGSGLDADLLDGQNSTAFLSTLSDFGRSGVATDLYESASTLTSKYVNTVGPDSVYTSSGTAFLGKVSGSSVQFVSGIKGYADNSSYGTAYGIYGYGASTGYAYGGFFSTGASGTASHYGVRGESYGSSSSYTYGIYGYGSNTSTGNVYAGYFSTSDSGSGTHYGVRGLGYSSTSATVFGIEGYGSNTSTGYAYGGYFSTNASGSGTHYGVMGAGSGSSSLPTYGVYGYSFNSSNGNAVAGYFLTSSSGTGAHYGVEARSFGNSANPTYGSYSYASDSSTGNAYGGFFETSSAGTGDHYGVSGVGYGSSSAITIGSYGYASNTSTGYASGGRFSTSSSGTGDHYGVIGEGYGSSSGATYGSYGYASNTSIGYASGGYFYASSSGTGTHYGVSGEGYGSSSGATYGSYGYADNTSTGYAYGGRFQASSAGTGTHYGVYGVEAAGGSGYAVYASGDMGASGTKSAVLKTSKGERLFYAQESPEVWFEDFGEGQVINGKAHIELDPLFLETVTINSFNPMKVFVQLEGDCNGVYVIKGLTGFDANEFKGGTSNATFTYRVVAKRKGYENERMRETDVGKDDPNLYPELWAQMERRHQEEKAQMEEEQKKMGEERMKMEKERERMREK